MYYMGQPQLRQVVIGGAGPRSSLFSASVVQGLGFHSYGLGVPAGSQPYWVDVPAGTGEGGAACGCAA